MFTIAPELRPYSALKVELSTLELLHCVDRRLKRDLVLDHVVEVDAVNHEVDFVFTTTGGVEREIPATKRRSQESVLRWGDRTRNQQT